MCKTILLIVCLLCTAYLTDAQQQQQSTATSSVSFPDPLCPIITIDCPETAQAGATVTFTAKIQGAGPDPHLTFAWSISGGTIIGGQGTTAIKVDTTGLSRQPITATIEVSGLDRSCSKTASCLTAIMPLMIYDHLDNFGAISLRDEQARLDNFAAELQSAPDTIGYITVYGGRRGRVGEVQRRAERAKQYLLKRRQIAAGRIVTVDGGYREEVTTELCITPPGATPPTASPTVSPDEVQIIHSNKQRRRPK